MTIHLWQDKALHVTKTVKYITIAICCFCTVCMTGVPELVCTFLTRENQMKPFMYKYYLINSFCVEASNTQESHFLATEYKLVGYFFFVKQDFSIIHMLYIRYFCSKRSPNRNVKD